MFDGKKRSVYRRTIGVQCVRRITTLGPEEALASILNSDLNHDVLQSFAGSASAFSLCLEFKLRFVDLRRLPLPVRPTPK